jgi:tRNA modification GTPase
VEVEGVRRARDRAAEADLVLWLTDATADLVLPEAEAPAGPVWLVENKVDLAGSHAQRSAPESMAASFRISAVHGQGLAELTAALAQFAAEYFASGEAALVTRARQKALLEMAVAALRRAGQVGGGADEILAEELRIASHALGRLLGRVDVEDILDKIFRDFCIGK